jgi:hypothetical protein
MKLFTFYELRQVCNILIHCGTYSQITCWTWNFSYVAVSLPNSVEVHGAFLVSA